MHNSSFQIAGAEVKCIFEDFFTTISHIALERRCILLLDEKMAALHGRKFKAFEVILVGSGENNKVQATIDVILMELMRKEADKEILLVGIGGGVITDIAGYVASIYKRGVELVLVPTTLLAMVDAALGGKNGVNLGIAKNMVGTIYQPKAIIFDFHWLQTLPDVEWESGMAEIIKHACIADLPMFEWLENVDPEFYKNQPKVLQELVRKNVAIKMNVVIKDAHDRSDRLLLNFGHTLGHALEHIAKIPHGHAVSIGMMFAAVLSVELNGLTIAEKNRIEALLKKFNLPVHTRIDPDRLYEVLLMDKKRSNHTMRFVLLNTLGVAGVQQIQLDKLKNDLNSFI